MGALKVMGALKHPSGANLLSAASPASPAAAKRKPPKKKAAAPKLSVEPPAHMLRPLEGGTPAKPKRTPRKTP